MKICKKCNRQIEKTHNCEHTKEQEYCVECYTELHYYLTESN